VKNPKGPNWTEIRIYDARRRDDAGAGDVLYAGV
jgi:hypothetical protein